MDVTPEVVHRAMSLAERHGLRGYDSIQLAVALELRDLCFASGLLEPTLVAADRELNAAAQVEGLSVDNPNSR